MTLFIIQHIFTIKVGQYLELHLGVGGPLVDVLEQVIDNLLAPVKLEKNPVPFLVMSNALG